MLQRLRRPSVVLVPTVLLLLLSACGSTSSTPSSASSTAVNGLDAVTIGGKVGVDPKVDFTEEMTAGAIATKTLVTGAGQTVKDGDKVLAQLVIGDGTTKAVAFDSYAKHQPQIITVDSTLAPFLSQALTGATVGSRVAVTSTADNIFPNGAGASLNINTGDGVLVVADVLGVLRDKPAGTRSAAPDWMPKIDFTKSMPSGMDFTNSPKPVGLFRKAVLLTGDGPTVKKGQTIAVNYLGEVYGASQAFSEDYTSGATGFSLDNVVPGWSKGLVGVPVGSRVVLEVPPALGYGATGNSSAKIKGTDTIFFVIDILAAG